MGNITRQERLAKNKKLKEIINPDIRLMERCKELRHVVEHPNEDSDILLQQGVYKHKNPEALMTIECDGVVVGYQVKPCSALVINPYFDRYVYVRTPNHRLTDLSDKEMATIKFTILEVFFVPQQGEIHLEIIGKGALLMWQRFMVVFPYKFQQATIQVPKEFNG